MNNRFFRLTLVSRNDYFEEGSPMRCEMRILYSVFFSLLFLAGCGEISNRDLVVLGSGQEGSTDDTPRSSVGSLAVTSQTGNVIADLGFAHDGTSVGLPAGIPVDRCRLTAALTNVDGSAISTTASISADGLITCKKLVQERDGVLPVTKGCVASYFMICLPDP